MKNRLVLNPLRLSGAFFPEEFSLDGIGEKRKITKATNSLVPARCRDVGV